MKLLADVDATDEFAINIELRVGRPLGVALQALPHLLVLVDVEGAIVQAVIIAEEGYDALGEATGWLGWMALHKEHDSFLVDQALDTGF
jgi:hypothetical protein